MKVNYSVLKKVLIVLCFLFSSRTIVSQTNVAYQIYLDANTNCNYDTGEQLLYNLATQVQLNYIDNTSATVQAIGPGQCSGNPLTAWTPSVPPTNTLNFIAYCPIFSYNSSCPAYTNLSYTSTNYLPVNNVSYQNNVTFTSPGLGSFTDSLSTVFPVCNNIGNDSIEFWFFHFNAYSSCSAPMASRTYSLYLDGNLYDVFTFTGFGSSITGTMAVMNEQYSFSQGWCTCTIKSVLGPGIATLGPHTWDLKSTQIYNTAQPVINYSFTLNSIPCSKVSGNIFVDCNSNCIKDPGDPPLGYATFAQIYQTVGGFSVNATPDANGNYSAYLPPSSNPYYLTSYSVTPSFTPCSSTTYTIPASASTNSINFGYTTSNYYDVSVFSQPAGPSSVGGTMYFKLTYCLNNLINCTPVPVNPGKVKLLVPTNFTYTSPAFSTPSPNTIIPGPSGDTLVWNVSDFNSLTTCIDYYVLVSISPTVTVGQQYCLSSFVNPLLDNVALNNQSTFCWYIGMPFDPNSKESYAPGIQSNGDIPIITTHLYYIVNFQNVGTAPAIDVRSVDTLDLNLDWTTLQILSSSDPVQSQVDYTSGQVIFYFQNINLPDSNTNEPASHGFVYFKIKLKPGLAVNTIIKNRAHNYFDTQAPVATNQTKNKLVNVTGVTEFEKINSVFVAPNPVSGKVTISSREMIQTISVFNNLGQIVLKQDVNAIQSQMDLSQMTDGIYFIQIQLKDGVKTTRKVVKN